MNHGKKVKTGSWEGMENHKYRKKNGKPEMNIITIVPEEQEDYYRKLLTSQIYFRLCTTTSNRLRRRSFIASTLSAEEL